MIIFAQCKSVNGARVTVTLTGYEEDASAECLLMQPCGVNGPSAWLPPSPGDVLVVEYNAERPECSVVLGVVYPDGHNPPRTGADDAAICAEHIYLGSPVPDTKCPRDDRVQSQLSAIKNELDSLTSAYNLHTHVVPTAGTSNATEAQHTQGYSVGDTASDTVFVR